MRTVTEYNLEEVKRLVSKGFKFYRVSDSAIQIDKTNIDDYLDGDCKDDWFVVDEFPATRAVNIQHILCVSKEILAQYKFLFYFIGKSSSGKDYMLEKVKECLKCKYIREFTTRPPRGGEDTINGRYRFITDADLKELNILESRTYDIKNPDDSDGKWVYGTLENELKEFNEADDNFRVASGSLVSFNSIVKYLENTSMKICVVPIYIESDSDALFESRYKRELKTSEPGKRNYTEFCRRWISDAKDFSIENLTNSGISSNNIFTNDFNIDSVATVIEYCKAYYTTFNNLMSNL